MYLCFLCLCCCRQDMIERLCRVFGVDYAEDPDESYVLTSDNFLKMMAIHMRFRYRNIKHSIPLDWILIYTHFVLNFYRCDIPVVIMGETGCGKTRLIRYMCDLQTCDTGVNNLLMLKVHSSFIMSNSSLVVKKIVGPWWNI